MGSAANTVAKKERKRKKGECEIRARQKRRHLFSLKGLAVSIFIGGWAVHSLGLYGPVACSCVASLGAVLFEKQKSWSQK